MCGIMACAALDSLDKQQLLLALKLLEYRGYDSAGVCFQDAEGGLTIEKVEGFVQGLQDSIDPQVMQANDGLAGLAHTRWATHGRPTKANAHPHVTEDGRLSMVHNGIIENYIAIKEKLMADKPRVWQSSTDTEVLLAWIHSEVSQGQSLMSVLKRVPEVCEGQYALVILDSHQPGQLFCLCQGSPLVVAKSRGQYWVASDRCALTHCDFYAVLPIKKPFCFQPGKETTGITWKILADDHHPLDHKTVKNCFTFTEIFQQSLVLNQMQKKLKQCFKPELLSLLNQVDQVLLMGCGSSHYAACVLEHYLEKALFVPCRTYIASEFLHHPLKRRGQTIGMVVFSQSGETMDTLLAVRHCRRVLGEDLKVVAISNQPQSSVVRESDFFINCDAGKEMGVATTKVFSAQLALSYHLSMQLTGAVYQDHEWIDAIKCAYALNEKIEVLVKLRQDKSVYFLGRSQAFPLAQEGALKLKELAYIHAEAYPCGELKHGPIALISDDFLCVLLVDAPHRNKHLATAQELIARGATVLALGAEADVSFLRQGLNDGVKSLLGLTARQLKSQESWSFFVTVVMQLLAYHSANTKGLSVDRPRNLAKCVTVE